MSKALWYRIRDLPPPVTVHVWLLVMGREFLGARGRDRSGRDIWAAVGSRGALAEVDRKVAEALPALGLWRPQYPDRWQAPLPPPVEAIEAGRMWSSTLRFQAVEEAESADLAREMEADRETARAQSGETYDKPRRGQGRSLWWLNPAAITYAKPGTVIARRDCEGRLLRALASDPFDLGSGGTGLHEMSLLAQGLDPLALRRLAEIEAARPFEMLIFRPTQADEGDYDTAMRWFAALTDPQRSVLRLASRMTALTFGEIGVVRQMSREGARQRYEAAIDAAWTIANGGVAGRLAAVRQALAACRDGNRRAKVGGV